ncbi:hypothetical protein ACFWOJ_10565 [Streptomyces sp. NPDC058439]|uniref:hypothetical protein n=1 Tax=Streptomyces sp. NPDC058439 TaxID=3346500 RepID=UPI0036655D5B
MVARFKDGRPVVFLIGTDRALWHVWTDAQGPEGFKATDTFGGGDAASIAVTRGRDGRLAFFHANKKGEVWVIRETAPSAGWGDFTKVFDGGQEIAAATQPDGRIAVFSATEGKARIHVEETPGGPWAPALDVSLPGGKVVRGDSANLVTDSDGRLLAVWVDQGVIAVARQDTVNGSAFTTSKIEGTENVVLQPTAVAGPGRGISLAYAAADGGATYVRLT